MYEAIVIGAVCFAVIGIFHPLVIKAEYYFGAKIWPLFLAAGLAFIAASFFIKINIIVNAALAITGFSSLWSILEVREQEKRVEKGWFPKNPKKKSVKKNE